MTVSALALTLTLLFTRIESLTQMTMKTLILTLAFATSSVLAAEPLRKATASPKAGPWPLDAVDASMTIHGDSRLAAGAVGQSLVLDGDSVIELKDGASLNAGAEGFTFSVWLNPYAPESGQQVIAGKSRYSLHERQGTLALEPNGTLKAFLQQSGWSTISSKGLLQAGHWHFATLTVGTDKAALYLNVETGTQLVLAR